MKTMKIKIIILVTFLISSVNTYCQQIGDGLSPVITDFTIPIKSGTYNGINPIGTIPDISFQGGWQHLLVIRHPNPENSYQLQIASLLIPVQYLTCWIHPFLHGMNRPAGFQYDLLGRFHPYIYMLQYLLSVFSKKNHHIPYRSWDYLGKMTTGSCKRHQPYPVLKYPQQPGCTLNCAVNTGL